MSGIREHGLSSSSCFPRYSQENSWIRQSVQPSAACDVLITLTPTVDTMHLHLALEITSCTAVQSSIFIPLFNPKSAGNISARHLLRTRRSHPLADGTGGQVAARSACTRALCWVEEKARWDSRLCEGSQCNICLPYPLCGLCFQACSRKWKLFLAIRKKRIKSVYLA